MKKAAAQQTAVSLGTKRTCPKCTAKFYDFQKPEIQCPKCGTEVDPDAELKAFKIPKKAEPKPKAIMRDEEEDAVASPAEFESVDDLGDDDESLDGIGAADDGDDE